ncbi:MAG: ABC transporter substrate-binding protein [Sphingomonas sp.]
MKLAALPLALATALAAAGCGGKPSDAPLSVSAIGARAAPGDPSAGHLDPARRLVMDATAQGLVRFDAAGQIEPGLAERWIVIDDGRSYIFRLREAEWPDGTPVTTEQAARVLRRAIAPGSRNALAPFLAVIDEVVPMTDTVIEVRLKRPRPDLLKLFAQPELAVFRLDTLGGSGPFRIRPDPAGGAMLAPRARSRRRARGNRDQARSRRDRAAARRARGAGDRALQERQRRSGARRQLRRLADRAGRAHSRSGHEDRSGRGAVRAGGGQSRRLPRRP